MTISLIKEKILFDTSNLPNVCYSSSFSVDGNYLAVAHASSPYVTIYKREGDVFTKLNNPDILPTGNANDVIFSADNNHLIVGHNTSPFITIYKREGDDFVKIVNGFTIPGTVNGLSFSPNNNYLAISHLNSPYLSIIKKTEDTFVKLNNPDILPSTASTKSSFSPNGNYLAVVHASSPYVTIYKRNEDTFTKLNNPDILPTGNGVSVKFSPNGKLLVVGHSGAPYITIYKREGDDFSKLTDVNLNINSAILGIDFSLDGVYLSISNVVTPFLIVYKIINNEFIRLNNLVINNNSAVRGVKFSPDKKHLISVGDYPYVTIYKNILKKVLFVVNNQYKTYDFNINNWVNLPFSNPSEEDYINYGIDEISLIPEKKILELGSNFNITFFTDSTENPSLNVMFPSYSKLDTLVDPEIITYSDAPNLNLEYEVDNFRPIDLIKEDFNIETLFKPSTDLNMITEGVKDVKYRYKIELIEPYQLIKQWSPYILGNIEEELIIPSRLLESSLNPYTIRVTLENEIGEIIFKEATISLYNTAPIIKINMIGMRADIEIEDNEFDAVSFKVLLNNEQIMPLEGEEQLIETKVEISKTFKSNEINIGIPNVLEVKAKDQFGEESSLEYIFKGDYSNIMFADEEEQFYTNDLSELIKYIDFGKILAGQTSLAKKIILINKNSFAIKNIKINVNDNNLDGVSIMLDKYENFANPSKLLFLNEQLMLNEKSYFFIRISVGRQVKYGGEFEIMTEADPV